MSAGPPPWSRSGQPAEPETTPDGLPIVRNRFGAFFVENGRAYPHITAEEEEARLRRFLARGPRLPAKPWSVWDV